MERHVGTWFKEKEPEKKEVAELLIDGNSIEFYSRFHGEVFPTTFIGSDGEYGYKVFVNGSTKPSSNRLLDYTSSHRVFYVLMQNFSFSKGIDISGIVEFSFSIPELIDWIGISTVFYGSTDMDKMAAGEMHLESIIIHSENPYVELYFESKSFNSSIRGDDRTEIIIKNEPRIKVQYTQEQDVQRVMDDIECIMQFFGLLIGTVSVAQDIRLTIKDQDLKSWLYFNRDFSYNTTIRDVLNRPRTYYYVVAEHLQRYYSNWRKFYFDDSYSLLRRIFFSVNGKKDIFAEDIFVEYMRILDGYHTRISGDEEIKGKIKAALKASTKEIKKLIFTDEGKPLFEDTIQSVIPEWKYKSKHMEDIAGWIAAGFLAKTSLSHRMQELDNQYLQIIRKNAAHIEKLRRDDSIIGAKQDEELIQLYFKELGDTRNYYSHYKLDKTGVLESVQMSDTINVLKATIISIFMSHMDIETDLIRKILEFDSELHFQTMCLRVDGEQPFKHPSELIKAEKNQSKEEK
ncbi:HEPN domain-containing protein [Clostridium sp. UBA5712]|uniref:ApeA N-terminal domain 1-containing protein n=1 Tax=Clostridium sp. UBA5712 TaxID=1946368 RepID=UPI0032163459